MKNLRFFKNAGLIAAFSLQVAAVSCFAALMHDVTGPRTYSARTVSNLALAALLLPGAAVAPLALAGRAADQLEGLA
tara:strand:+ start:950 stop:1180 length:231 start_codon:yes stop_codon:yes gene_type:complete